MHAVKLCKQLFDADKERQARRVKVQSSFNGFAPKSHSDLVKAGRSADANLNWRRMRGIITSAASPFFDSVMEVNVCIDGELDYAEAAQNDELMRGFAEYFHAMVFGERGFDELNQLTDLQMLLHGVGIMSWENPWAVMPKPVLNGNFYVPNGVSASLDDCERAVFSTPMNAGDLWTKITPEEQAVGWNIPAVKRAIMASAKATSDLRGGNWERWVQAFKNGDIYVSSHETNTIQTATLVVREMSGRISQKIVCTKTGSEEPAEFLFEDHETYSSWDEALTLFAYDIGADGTYHSINGLGTDIYPFTTLLNGIDNSTADLVLSGIKPMWQPSSSAKMEDFKMTKWGGGNFIPNGINPLQVDISRGINPAIEASRYFGSTLTTNTAAVSNDDFTPPTVEETKAAAMIRASERSKAAKGLYTRYARSRDRLYAEMWRRAVSSKVRAHHPGGELILKFQARCKRLCLKLGIPWTRNFTADESPTGKAGTLTVLECVENVRSNRSLGLGNPALRYEIVSQLSDPNYMDRLDEQGQNHVLRMKAAVLTSYGNVDAIVPSLQTGRDSTNDESIATLENAALAAGGKALVSPGQNHVLHLGIHVGAMEESAQLCQQGQQDPQECFAILSGTGPHADEHLARLAGNPTRKQEHREYKARTDAVEAYAKELQSQIEAQQQDAGAQQQEQSEGMAKVQGNLALKAQKDQGTLELKAQSQQHKQAMQEQDQQHKQALAAQQAQFDRAIADAQAGSEINRKTQIHRVDTGIKLASAAQPEAAV